MKENRADPRFEEKDIVNITVSAVSQGTGLLERSFFALTRDLSAAGLSFSVQTPPEVGARLKLTVVFFSPQRSVKGLTGRVAWIQRVPTGGRHVVGVDLSESAMPRLVEWKRAIGKRIVTE